MAAKALVTPGQPLAVAYKAVDGLGLQLDLYRPPRDFAPPHPIVLWIHGGALIMGSRTDLPQYRAEQLQTYVEAGWAVAAIDYRLAPRTKLREIWRDVESAYSFLRQAGPTFELDPDRTVLVGVSGGGYLALLAGVRLSPKPTAVVSYFGYADIIAPWYTSPSEHYSQMPRVSEAEAWQSIDARPSADEPAPTPRMQFYIYARQNGLWPSLVGGNAELDSYCPVRHVTSEYPPTMLLHGDCDDDVPASQSIDMATALTLAGVKHQLRIVKGAGHSFDRGSPTGEAAAAVRAATEFISLHLAG